MIVYYISEQILKIKILRNDQKRYQRIVMVRFYQEIETITETVAFLYM